MTSTETGKVMSSIHWHQGIVTCLSYDNDLLATGSLDATVAIWEFVQLRQLKKLASLGGHFQGIAYVAINKTQKIVVSVDFDGILIINDLNTFKTMQKIQLNYAQKVIYPLINQLQKRLFMIAISEDYGYVAIYNPDDAQLQEQDNSQLYGSITVFNINLHIVLVVKVDQPLNSLIFYHDFLIVGGAQNSLIMYHLNNSKKYASQNFKSSIRAISVLDNRHIYCGLQNGELIQMEMQDKDTKIVREWVSKIGFSNF